MKINDLGVAFRKYGRVISGVDFSGLVDKMEEIPAASKRAWITGRGMQC